MSKLSLLCNLFKPASLDTVLLKRKDGKFITLQAMMHIAPAEFYQHVNTNIKSFLYTHPNGKVFLEGVYNIEGDIESKEQMQQILSGSLFLEKDVELKDLYRAFAKFLGWNMQDAENYLNGVPDYVLVTADISSQEFVRLYNAQSDKVDETTVKNKKRWSEALKAFLDKKENKITQKDLEEIVQNKDNLNARILKPIIKKGLKTAISSAQSGSDILKELSVRDPLLSSIIIDTRNNRLIDMIEQAETDIFVTYGAAHLYCGDFALINALKSRGYELVSIGKYKL
jgi:hypothetical protein